MQDLDMSASQITATSPPNALSIAGFDPSAGAGILADLKTFSAMGVYGAACITALTVQSTTGVRRVEPLDPSLVVETLECLAEDLGFSAIKVGMLGNGAIAASVAGWMRRQTTAAPVMLDPILRSSSGHALLDRDGIDCLRQEWLDVARWITPNLPELAVLTGEPEPGNREETEHLARRLQKMAADRGNPDLRIVVTGGHADKPDDLLLTPNECRWFPGERVRTPSTHGTGCAFSSALAARIALGDDDAAAVQAAKEYVAGALRSAYPVGRGKGPVNHAWNCSR
jgi:hydroxymethylpyrimidine/phosphomethylpyrimidine kinase